MTVHRDVRNPRTTCATPSPHPHPTEWSSSVDPVFWILVACMAYFLLTDLIDKL